MGSDQFYPVEINMSNRYSHPALSLCTFHAEVCYGCFLDRPNGRVPDSSGLFCSPSSIFMSLKSQLTSILPDLLIAAAGEKKHLTRIIQRANKKKIYKI